jgi:hypothetical protein
VPPAITVATMSETRPAWATDSRRTAHIMPVAERASTGEHLKTRGEHAVPRLRSPVAGHRVGATEQHGARSNAEKEIAVPAPEEALSAGNITFTGFEGAEINAYQALPAGLGPSPGSWSSTTFPVGTRRRRRSHGASPPRVTTPSAPTSTPARGSMSIPTTPRPRRARPAASPTTSSSVTPRPR